VVILLTGARNSLNLTRQKGKNRIMSGKKEKPEESRMDCHHFAAAGPHSSLIRKRRGGLPPHEEGEESWIKKEAAAVTLPDEKFWGLIFESGEGCCREREGFSRCIKRVTPYPGGSH